jgi:CRP-like cAMP-binding protein
MEPFVSYIRNRVTISDKDLGMVLSSFGTRKVSKSRLLIKEGQVVADYYFVLSGGFRICYRHGDKQITSWVALENTFFSDLESLNTNKPSRFSIQAIEDTEILCIGKSDMSLLYKTCPPWQEFGRKVWEEAFLNVMKGALKFQTMSAEERYLSELEQPGLFKRIPLKQLASYLGITPTSLSRLRRSIK